MEFPALDPNNDTSDHEFLQETEEMFSHVGGATDVEVTALVASMCGLLALDGPFSTITSNRNLQAFENRSMTMAVVQMAGLWPERAYLGKLLLCLTAVIVFFGSQIATSNVRSVDSAERCERADLVLTIAAALAITVLLLDEGAHVVEQVKDTRTIKGLATFQ